MNFAFGVHALKHWLSRSGLIAVILSCPGLADTGVQPITLGASHDHRHGDSPCFTQVWHDWQYGRYKGAIICLPEGICDNPGVRNSWIPGPDQPITTIALFFHILTGENGTNPALSAEDLADAVDSLNADFLPYRIQFIYHYRFILSSQFRTLNTWDEFNLMKETFALDPESQCNVFVTGVSIEGMTFSWGSYPWDPGAQGLLGGIVMATTNVPPTDYGTLTHEMGHALGLYHTFYGVDEVEPCSGCYESPQQQTNDWVGDFCSDTDPSPENYLCGPPGGIDPCLYIPWGTTQPENHMAYTPLWCRNEFSAQQAGRMHCWLRDRMEGWIASVDFAADVTSGPAPLQVQFTSEIAHEVLDWFWSFGDGGSSDEAHPVHTYLEPGRHDVTLTVATTNGTFTRTRSECIWAYADTLAVPSVLGRAGESVRFDIYARNTQPVDRLRIPITWTGTLSLSLDSVSTVGLRTASIANQHFIHLDPSNRRATYEINPEPGEVIAPDTGALLSMYFTCAHGFHDQTSPVSVQPYEQYQALFSCPMGIVVPIRLSGQLKLCAVGDVSYDGSNPNVADLTYLVTYLFRSGPEPPVIVTADVNGIPPINIGDLTYLVAFLFKGGPPPPCW